MSGNLSKALTKLAFDQPFFGTLLAMTDLIEDKGIQTLATDGRAIFYNPAFIADLTGETAMGALCHEILHIIYLHCLASRRGARDSLRWNIACDFAVNQELTGWRFKLPAGALLNPKFQGMNAEEIYDRLPDIKRFVCLDEHYPMPDDLKDEMVGRIISAAQANPGKLPAELARLVKNLAGSRVPWNRVLRRFLKESLGREAQSYLPPNRRHLWDGRYLPAARTALRGRLVVAVDTSGSITTPLLASFAAELRAISDLCEDITVLTCDAKVHQTVKTGELATFLVRLVFKGGGGTDFRPVFDFVKEKKLRPDALLYLTDGDGAYPRTRPKGYPVLWCLTKRNDVPWGPSVVLPCA